MKNVVKISISIASVFACGLLYYVWQPTLSLAYFDGFSFFAFIALIISGNIMLWKSDIDNGEFFWKPVAIVSGVVVGIAIVGGILGTSIFNGGSMHRQIGEVDYVEYDEMIKEIDHSQIPIVDDDLAQKQADKKMGEDLALGSRAHLGDAVIQEVNGEIIYVAYLEHDSLFKWLTFKTTPGYITVSATNQNKVDYITTVGDDEIEVLYSPNARFSKDLKRHIRNQGFINQGLTDLTFELDDSGMPFWVVTTYRNTTLWQNPESTGVIIVDAQNGDTQYYSMDEIPDWVDIVQPVDFIENQINNWGKLIHGFWNFSNKDKIEKTNDILTVYSEGECYYFTGMTSVGSDESCVGFIMVNTRDKSAKFCKMSGATEDAAMKSAEGTVSDMGYTSTEPLPLNVNGIPTYVMALKDDAGLIKSYAMVNIELYSIAASGDTLQKVSRAYMQKVANSGQNTVVSSDEAYGYTLEGKVSRISPVVEEGSTYYYIIIENEENKIFTASYFTSDELAITRDGDTVVISYIDDKNGTVDIVTFDNTSYGVTISEDQENRNELDEGSSALDGKYNQIVEVDPEMNQEKWDSLTEEEKAKLIQELLENE